MWYFVDAEQEYRPPREGDLVRLQRRLQGARPRELAPRPPTTNTNSDSGDQTAGRTFVPARSEGSTGEGTMSLTRFN